MTAPVILVEASPRNPADGSVVAVRLAGGGFRVPYAYGGYNDWRAGIAALPTFIASLEFDGGEFPTGSVPSAAEIIWAPSSRVDLATIAALMWIDAPISVRIGPEGTLPPVVLAGNVLDVTVENGQLKLALADPATSIKKPLLTTRFAGTGGLEGPVEWQGLIRKRVFGRVWNLRAEPIDKANNVYCLADPTRQISSIDAVRDKGAAAASLTTQAWAGSVAATFAALQAAAAPTGGGVICPSIACIKWWTQPAGDLCADLKGEVGAGYVETTAEIAKLLVDAITGPAFASGTVAAAATARPAPVGWVAKDENTTVAAMLDDLFGNSSLIWLLNGAGEIVIRQWTFGASVASVTSQDVTRKKQLRPVATRKIGYQRNELPMNRGDLAAIVLVADVSGLGPWATTSTPVASVTAPGSNLFPWPRGAADRTTAALGWGNTAATTSFGVLSNFVYTPLGGLIYQTNRASGGAAVTLLPYYDVPITNVGGTAWSVSMAGYATNGAFQPSFQFLNSSNANIGETFLAANATTNRYEGSAAQPAGAVKIRVIARGAFASAGGYQDLTFWAIKLEASAQPTPYTEDNSAIAATTVTYPDGSTATALQPTEAASDVTSAIVGVDVDMMADYTGAITDTLPRLAQYKFTRQGVDLTTSAAWSVAVISGTIAASIGAATGLLSLNTSSGALTNSVLELTAVYGTTTRKFRVQVNVNKALAPSGGSGGGTSSSTGFSGTVNTTSMAALGPELTITVGIGGSAALTADYSFTMASGSGGIVAQWYWWNGSAYVALGSGVASTDNAISSDGTPGDGTITFTDTGRTALSTQKYKPFAKTSSGTTARAVSGNVSAVGS